MQEIALTIDVEEYYHAENIQNSLLSEQIQQLPSRVEIGTYRILELLAKFAHTATFFVLGCVAEKHKKMIADIAGAGHEIASHGYEHVPLHKQTPASFCVDLKKSTKILEDSSQQRIHGYRATSFSMTRDTAWAYEILAENGIAYDSSLAHSFFRANGFEVLSRENSKTSGVKELPVSGFSLGHFTLPLGGGYFRAYPLWLTTIGLKQSQKNSANPSVFYLHPWELDPQQPRFQISPLKAFRHYLGLESAEKKLTRLLSAFRFGSIREYLKL